MDVDIRNITFVACIALAGMCGATSQAWATPTSTPDEMRAFAITAVKDIKSMASDVAKLTEQAHKNNNAGVINCLTPRNVSMQALVQVATGATKKMNEALTEDVTRWLAYLNYRQIAAAVFTAKSINGEAQDCNQCAGPIDNPKGWAGCDKDKNFLNIGFDPPPVSPDEMRAIADAAVKDIKSMASDVAKLREQARKDSDAGVLECLTPHYISMQALVQLATSATHEINEAHNTAPLNYPDPLYSELANFYYREIATAVFAARSINGEAQDCN